VSHLSRRWFLVIASIPVLTISYLIANEIQESIKCKEVKNERVASNNRVISLEERALQEWNSFPLIGDGSGTRDPNPGGGGQIFSSFDEYFRSNYSSKVQDEKEIGYRLVLSYPECFPLREVVEIQGIWND